MKVMYMTIDEIAIDYDNGAYRSKKSYPTGKFKEDHIFDENQSVKWNREEVIRQNEILVQQRKEHNEDDARLGDLLRANVVYNLVCDYELNQQQAEYAYDTAYTDKHSHMTDVFYYATTLAEFYEKMNILKG